MHIVLFSNYLKVLQSGSDRVIVFDDIHFVFNHVAGMRDKLATYHPLVFTVVAEGIAHAAMPTRDTHATFDRFQQPMLLLPGNRAHCPDGNNEAKGMHLSLIEVDIKRIGDLHIVALFPQKRRKEVNALSWFMPRPPSPDE